ncbi:MAG: lamin tail domain-containing protein, partial [Bacteroidota bacterium]
MNTIRIVGIWLALFIITILKAKGQLIINEYSCGNINIVTDNYGDREDWVELYNTGSVAVDLTGFCLSDRANNPTKWPFPTGSIAPNGFVRIWTSGRNIVVGNNYHASFKLNQTENEKIILATTAGLIVDSLTLKRHQANHSWGRTTDGSNSWSIFTTPTVNTTNNTSTPYTRYAAMPTFSQNAGYYANTVTVSVSTTESNSTIYYTTNGFVPTTASSVYSSALTFNSTTVLKAYVVSTD